MKKTILFLFILGILTSCSKEENENSVTTELVGQWKLIEQLADPGDGSGTFKSIDSQKIIEFSKNEIVTSKNGSLCQPYSDEHISSGTYSLSDKRISTNCQNANIAFIGFEIKEGYLLLHFASYEGFSQKFEKIK